MGHWASEQLEKKRLREYQAEWNSDSLDGLVGLTVARRDRGERLWLTGARAWGRRLFAQKDTLAVGMVLGIILMFLVQMATPWLQAITSVFMLRFPQHLLISNPEGLQL